MRLYEKKKQQRPKMTRNYDLENIEIIDINRKSICHTANKLEDGRRVKEKRKKEQKFERYKQKEKEKKDNEKWEKEEKEKREKNEKEKREKERIGKIRIE